MCHPAVSPTPRDADSRDPSRERAGGFTLFRLFPVIPEPNRVPLARMRDVAVAAAAAP